MVEKPSTKHHSGSQFNEKPIYRKEKQIQKTPKSHGPQRSPESACPCCTSGEDFKKIFYPL